MALLLALAGTHAQAATRYWDGGTVDIAANGDGTADGDTGTWNTTIKNWDQGNGLAHTNWVNANNDIARTGDGVTPTFNLGADITIGGFSVANTTAISGGAYKLTLGISGDNTFLAAANSTVGRILTLNAVIAGGPANNLVLAGPATSGTGTINLGSANTFGGVTSFSAGATGGISVSLKHQLAFQNSTVILSAASKLTFDSSVSANAFTFGGLSADSAGTGYNLALQNNNAATPIALTVGGNTNSTTYSGVLSGGGSLIKTGGGTLILDSANTYTGNTTIGNGTLQVDGVIVSPTTVNSGATLAGGGQVNATVTVAAGGTLTAGDGISGSLTVSNLTFSGTGTLEVGTLSGYTSVAAINVTSVLALSGGAGAVTINLPTTPGFNGIYHLVQFGSGTVTTSLFTLGTVPALNANQTGALQVNGNYLDYVITAAGDTTPPTLGSTYPANNATNVLPDASLVATFNETIVAGSGSIELRRSSDAGLVESFNVTSSPHVAFSTAQLIIQPTNILATNQQYYVLIPFGAVKDTSGNSFAGITTTTGWRFTVPAPVVLYTDTGSPANPLWSAILPTLNVQSPDSGPVYGSLINVNNPAVEIGLYGNRPISVGTQKIHVACNTAVGSSSFANFTRWFQTDGNTQVLRVFVDDENTATSRPPPSSHTEAFASGGWNYTDNATHEWTGHYTGAHLKQSFAGFQLKNSDNDWAFQLSVKSNGSVSMNPRYGTDVVVTNPDGSVKYFDERGFDMRVLDDGKFYKVWIDGVLYGNGAFSRPTGTTVFRWGMYFGANKLNPPADYNLLLVSGAQTQSWPGTLATPTTTIVKANNTTSLDNGASWTGGVDPGLYNQAVWDSTVTGANTTTLASYQEWAGLKILNPGGLVTINGTAILGLNAAGVDMSAASQNLVVNCPVQMPVASTWSIAAGRTATFNGIISGYPGLTLNGGGTLLLNAANTYSGDTTISASTVVANNNSALGAGLLVFNGGTLSNSASCTLGNDVNLSSNATIDVGASQTLTLNGAIASTGYLTKTGTGTLTLSGANTYTGATVISGGTLAIGNTSALLTTTGLTLAGGTLLQPNLDGVIISAPITVGGSGTTATISAPTNAPGGGVVSTLTLNSAIAGSGNVTFSSSVNQDALSTVYLGGQSSYSGNTKLDTAGTTESQVILKLGINNALPTNTALTIDGQTGAGSDRFAEFNLNGFNQTLVGLTNVPRSLRVQRVVNSSVSAPATLTVNNSGSYTFSGNLGGTGGSVSSSAMPGSSNGNNFGLTKGGTGTYTLTGINTYIGNTTVSQGTLSLGAINPSNEASTVTIAATGAALNLNFTGTDTVNKLFIGSTQKPPGIYGAVGTAAPVIGIPQITGTGTLTVTSGPAPGYAGWALTNAGAQGTGLDYDNDGVANGLEYVLGGSPSTRDLGRLPNVSVTGGNLVFTFIRDQASIDGATVLTIQASDNLTDWLENYPVPNTAVTNNPGVTVLKGTPAGFDTITLTLPLSGQRKFLRLKVQN